MHPFDRQLAQFAAQYQITAALRGECAFRYRFLKDGVPRWVPCGKCLKCNARRQNMLVGRMMAETACHEFSCVYTLTYDEDRYQKRWPELHMAWLMGETQDAAKWARHYKSKILSENFSLLKRIKHHWPDWSGRYYVVWEVGEQNGRLHCHIILYGIPYLPPRKQEITEVPWWKHGRVQHDGMSPAAAGYCADYVTSAEKRSLKVHSRGSNHLGTSFVKTQLEQLAGVRPWPGLALTKLRQEPLEAPVFEFDYRLYFLSPSMVDYAQELGILEVKTDAVLFLEDRDLLHDMDGVRNGLSEAEYQRKQIGRFKKDAQLLSDSKKQRLSVEEDGFVHYL